MNANCISLTCVTLLACFPIAARLDAAQTAAVRKAEAQAKDARKQLDDANDEVKAARQKLEASRMELNQAQSAQENKTAKVQKTLQAAVQEHGAKLGLSQVLAELQAAQREADGIKQLVVTALKGESGYQQAAKAADAASGELKAARDDGSLSAEERQQKSSALSAVIRRPVEMERQRLEGDTSYQAALRKYNDARQEIVRLEKRALKEAESDPEVQKAQAAAKQAQEELNKAEKEVGTRQKELTVAQNKAAQEQKQYQQAAAQEKREEAKAKNKNKNKGKK